MLTSQLLTNGQMDKQTGHGTPISHLRANADATKKKKKKKKKKNEEYEYQCWQWTVNSQ